MSHPFLITSLVIVLSSGAQALESIKIVYNDAWPPYSYLDKDSNETKGILINLLDNLLVKHLSIKTLNHAQPWPRVQRSVESGDMDAFITVPTDERLEYSLRSKNIVYSIRMQALTRNDTKLIHQFEAMEDYADFNKVKVCEINGNGWGYRFWEKHGISFETLSTTDKCLQQISLGRSDVMVLPFAVARTYLKTASKKASLALTKKIFGQMDFVLLLSKKSKFNQALLDQFDEVLYQLKADNQYDAVIMQSINDEVDATES